MNAMVRQIKAKHLQAQPIRSENTFFLIGRNSRGNWVVQGQDGLCGGLFTGEAAALKFALAENGNHPEAVRRVRGVFELDMAASPRTAGSHELAPARLRSSRYGGSHVFADPVEDRENSPGRQPVPRTLIRNKTAA